MRDDIKRKAGILVLLMASAALPAEAHAGHKAHPPHHSKTSLRSHFTHAVARTAHAIGRAIAYGWTDPAVAIFDHASGLPLYVQQEHATEKHDMASTTKMMTALLFADYVVAKGSDWDMPVEITPEDQRQPGGNVNMIGPHSRHPATVKLTARQLLLAMMLPSCNAAAHAAVRYIGGGDRSTGVALMNKRAADWGMADTHYTNGAGWKHPQHYSTVTDMEVPLRHLIDDSRYAEVARAARTPNFSFPGVRVPYHNHNRLLVSLPGMQEGKTGMTNGYSLVASAFDPAAKETAAPRRIDICVLGDKNRQHRDAIVTAKLADSFAHYDAYLAAAQEKAARSLLPEPPPPFLPIQPDIQ